MAREAAPAVTSTLIQVDPNDVTVDNTYQRALRSTYKRIAASFDPLLAGVIILSRRPSGTLWVIDGQHRLMAAREAQIATLNALVYEGLTLEDEARMFAQTNQMRIKVNSFDLYNASKTIRGTVFFNLATVANQVGTPIVGIAETGPRTIGLYARKLAQLGMPRTKEVLMVNKLCNKRHDHDLYNEKIQRAIYSKLATQTRQQVIDKINAIPNLRTLIAQSYAGPLADYGDLLN